jgi:hypothetical protein
MGLTKRNTANSKSAKLTQRLFKRSTVPQFSISRRQPSQSSFPDKVAKANELLKRQM